MQKIKPEKERPALSVDQCQATRDYLLWRLRHAQNGLTTAREAKRYDNSGQAARQMVYWSNVVAAIQWCLDGIRHCAPAPNLGESNDPG